MKMDNKGRVLIFNQNGARLGWRKVCAVKTKPYITYDNKKYYLANAKPYRASSRECVGCSAYEVRI